MSRRIPQEMYEEILANLQDDEVSLQNCTLVCRAWLPRARHHLFHSITLDPSSRSPRFKELIRSCQDVAPLVRVLELRGRAWARRGWWDPENGLPANLMWPTLPGMQNHPSRRDSDVLETLSWLRGTFTSSSSPSHDPVAAISLPNVRSLRLDEVTFNSDTAAFLAAAFPRLESLTLNGCRAMAFASLVDLMQSFLLLRTLRLLSAEWLPLPHHAEHALPRPTDTTSTSTTVPDLVNLEFTRDIFVQPVLEWLSKVEAHKTVRSLKCSITTQASANALRAFLQASGPMLQRLYMTLSESRGPTSILEATQFTLSTCTGLERLEIQCSPPHHMPPSEHRSLSWVLILLSKVRSPCLREIRISIASAQLSRLNLEGLDVVLAKDCYGSLEHLTFILDSIRAGGGGRDKVKRTLTERMSTAHAQGLIQVEYA
ncbi:hypothetical protein L226DRAFT_462971 [Lentinus tigrinus ALCF2SS1-7]|uniref:F-box domain-containing protein n=1 Tax=Lentinus tigrinus ALCF2SS1-6 TaxID=1328759 RepID=A0A5C2SF59_9APHY|nr:hypothetical protein L227DRAFT_502572 [Lentinus tigrinus ALCF2SS1-6]RPD74699.1 hypothetical protein L226DRAFT_462971 [Lentinus tigrinus ALCF2SS1-7]